MAFEIGKIQTVVGTGEVAYAGDGGPATQALIGEAYGCDFDTEGNLYICDGRNHTIRRIDRDSGVIVTVAGSGRQGYSGDGGRATEATLNNLYSLQVDTNGDIYIVDRLNAAIRKVDAATGIITTVAGTGEPGYGGDGGPGVLAQLREPNDCFLDGKGGLLIADIQDQRIRRLDLRSGIITTFAGNGEEGRTGDGNGTAGAGGPGGGGGAGGPATKAGLERPHGCGIDPQGHLYIADGMNHRVRVVGMG